MLIIYAGLLALTGWRLTATPTGFIPEQDQGFLIGVVQLPPGASLERTSDVLQQAQQARAATRQGVRRGRDLRRARRRELLAGVQRRHDVHPAAPTWSDRECRGQSAARSVAGADRQDRRRDRGGQRLLHRAAGGAGPRQRQRLHDDDAGPVRAPAIARSKASTFGMMGAAAQVPEVTQVFSLFNTGSPRIAGRRRPRPGAVARRPAGAGLRGARHLSRLDLRQRLQHARPHLPRDRAGRAHGARRRSPTSAGCRCARRAGRWCRCRRSPRLRNDSGPVARRALQPVPRGRAAGPGGARRVVGRGA